jgi:hypothetical protein
MQIITYADDVVLIARTENRDLVDGLHSLESAAMRIGLRINQNKTKYMAVNAKRLLDPLILEIGPYTSEHVHTFTYLGTKFNKENDITEEVRNRIAAANRCYFSLQKHLKSNFVSRTTKILSYKMVCPIATYWGFYSRWIFISTPKLKTLQLNAVSNSPNTSGQSIVGLSVHLHARTAPQHIVRH